MLRSRPCCLYKASWKGAALRFNGIRSCQLELWRIAVDSETPAEGRQWRRLRRWSAQRMQNRPHGRATDLTHDPVTQMQVPCHPPVPTRSALPGAYLRRYGSLVASRQSERALARTRSREMARALGAMPPGTGTGCPTKWGAPAQMAFVVFTTPQVPLRGPPIPTSALWAVFQYHHKQLHSGGCATQPRQMADGTCSASQARPFSSCCHQLGGVLLFCVLCSWLRAITLIP